MYCSVLTAPNVCSYTTLAKMNCQISTRLTPVLVLFPQNFFLFSIPTLHACVNGDGGQFEHFLLKLSSFVSVAFLTLFFINFLNPC